MSELDIDKERRDRRDDTEAERKKAEKARRNANAKRERLPRILLLTNPNAGRGFDPEVLGRMVHSLGKDGAYVTCRQTQYAGDIADSVRNEADRYDLICCSGGDGSIHEAAAAAADCDPSPVLGYFPIGSTCDFARSLGIPTDLDRAGRAIREGESFTPDLGYADGAPFIYVASFGAFTEASYKTSHDLKAKIGTLAYMVEGLRSIPSIEALPCKIEADGTHFEGEYIFGAVLNTYSLGGILKVDRSGPVSLNDGMFELLLVRAPQSSLQTASLLKQMLAGNYEHELIEKRSIRHAVLEFEKEVPFTLDGEFGGDKKTVGIDVRASAYTLRVPRDIERNDKDDDPDR